MIVIYVLLSLILLFIFLPIRIGASGSISQEGFGFRAWARPWAGVLGVGLNRVEGITVVGPMVGGWLPWGKRLKKKEPAEEVEEEAEPPEEEAEEEAGEEEAVPETLRQRVDRILVLAERGWAYLQGLGPALGRFLKRLTGVLGLNRVVCDFVFGTPNPALTGRVFGYIQAISSVMGSRTQVVVTPDFMETRLEGEGKLDVSFYLHRLLWAVFCLAGSGLKAFGKDWWAQRKRRRT